MPVPGLSAPVVVHLQFDPDTGNMQFGLPQGIAIPRGLLLLEEARRRLLALALPQAPQEVGTPILMANGPLPKLPQRH